MEKSSSAVFTSDLQQTLTAAVAVLPDGSVRMRFALAPSGQPVGQIVADAVNPELLAVLATNFAQWAVANRGGVAVAPADALAGLDAARRTNGSAGH